MRLISLFLLLPALSFSRRLRDVHLKEIARNDQWEESELVVQPKRPDEKKYRTYKIKLFYWTTNATRMAEMNKENITFNMNTYDLGIVCKFDRTKVVLRLIPEAAADSCEYEGGVIAHCPDLNIIPLLYAEHFGPGRYVLTTFSDGTPEGRHATSGGFCREGVKVPITIFSERRNWADFNEDEVERPTTEKTSMWIHKDDEHRLHSIDSSSSISVTISMAILLPLFVRL